MGMNYNDSVLFSLLFFAAIKSLKCMQPHIILVAVDNLGFNDVGFHGKSEIPTPNIDALAYSGVILNNYYVYPFSNQSISALMRGRYPSQTQLPFTKYMPLLGKILPDYLYELGYTNHIIGKFEFEGWEPEIKDDFAEDTSEEYIWYGKYGRHRKTFLGQVTRLNRYTRDTFDEARKIILRHNTSKPLFLYIGDDMEHTVDFVSIWESCGDVKCDNTQKYKLALHTLDQHIGLLFHAIKEKGIMGNSIIIFTSTNGGESGVVENSEIRNIKSDDPDWIQMELLKMMSKKNLEMSSNYPLRGGKGVVFEGGIRGTAFIWSHLIRKRSIVSNGMMQIVDWLPTILDATCGDSRKMNLPYAVSMWKTIFFGLDSPRYEMLHMLDTVKDVAALTLGEWKLITGDEGKLGLWTKYDFWGSEYNFDLVSNSLIGQDLKQAMGLPSRDRMEKIKEYATVRCTFGVMNLQCEPKNLPCLFNLRDDPCEYENLAHKNFVMVSKLLRRIGWHSEFTIRDHNDTIFIPKDNTETPISLVEEQSFFIETQMSYLKLIFQMGIFVIVMWFT